VTARDRIVLIVVAGLAVLAGFWFLVLGPKRDDAKAISDQLSAAQQRLETAQQSAASAEAARRRYTSDYATVARLGKAVPVQDDVPSLVYQLEATAHDHHIDFRSIKLESSGSGSISTPNAAAAVASANGTTPAAATSAAAATLPPGATVGAAGFPTMPFSFNFDGSFFDMQKFLRSVDGLTSAQGQNISVKGRLLTVDGFSLKASRKGFPRVQATIAATAYLLPADQGLTNGATPTGPAGSGSSSSSTAPTQSAAIAGSVR
jgi:Tfp pilus assembly protein PilO